MLVCGSSRVSGCNLSGRTTSNRSSRALTAANHRSQAMSFAMSSRIAYGGWEDVRQTSGQIGLNSHQSYATDAPKRAATTMMGNKATGGPFSPLVIVARNVIGEKDFNKIRGKAISLHSQVIKEFSLKIGVDNKQVQGLIRLAKKNGEKLGFLA